MVKVMKLLEQSNQPRWQAFDARQDPKAMVETAKLLIGKSLDCTVFITKVPPDVDD